MLQVHGQAIVGGERTFGANKMDSTLTTLGTFLLGMFVGYMIVKSDVIIHFIFDKMLRSKK
jgi:hypothetical protein